MKKKNKICYDEKQLLKYLNGEVDKETSHQIEEHIADCEICMDVMEGLLMIENQEELEHHTHQINKEIDKKIFSLNQQHSFLYRYRAIVAVFLIVFVSGVVFLINRFTESKNDIIPVNIAESRIENSQMLENEEITEILNDKQPQEELTAENKKNILLPNSTQNYDRTEKNIEQSQITSMGFSVPAEESYNVKEEDSVGEIKGIADADSGFDTYTIVAEKKKDEQLDTKINSNYDPSVQKLFKPGGRNKTSSRDKYSENEETKATQNDELQNVNVITTTADNLIPPRFNYQDMSFENYVFSKIDEQILRDLQKNVVLVSFIVTKSGQLINPKIIEGINADVDSLIISIIKDSPEWIPAKMNNETINKELVLKINLKK